MAKNFISAIFGRSPVHPLQQHMAKVIACVEELPAFFDASIRGDWETATRVRENIRQLEHDADTLKIDIRLHLPNTLFMPVARADLLDLLTVQDRVANKAKDISGLMIGRQMRIPQELGVMFMKFLDGALAACRQAHTTVNELDEVFEAGFRGAEVDLIHSMITELDRLERESDHVEIEVRRALFEMEKTLPPVDVVFLYKIIDWIGDLADESERIGSRLQLLLAR